MASTTDLGRLFFQFVRLQTASGERAPLVGIIPSQETEEPFRTGKAIYLRLPFTDFGFIFGLWSDSGLDEEEALYTALSGWGMDLYEAGVDLADPAVQDHVRRAIAENFDDLDEEWEVVQMLGLDGSVDDDDDALSYVFDTEEDEVEWE